MGKSAIDPANSSIVSTEYTDYSDPSQLFSTDPSRGFEPEVVDLTAPASCSGESHYSETPTLPAHFNLDSRVRVNHGVERTVTVRQLLHEAESNPQALAEISQLAMARAADFQATQACYLVTDDNTDHLLTVLAQLSSTDPLTRREGATTLTQFLLSTEDRQLQRGLLVTVDQMRTPEAKDVLTEVHRRSSEDRTLRQYLERLPTHGLYLRNQSQLVAQNAGNSGSNSPVAATSSAELLTLAGDATTVIPGLAVAPTTPFVLSQLTAMISEALERPTSKALGIEASQSAAIATRLVEVAANTPPEQWLPTFRAVFMSAGWNHPEFTAGQFTQLAGLAEEVARTAVSRLHSGSSVPSHSISTIGENPAPSLAVSGDATRIASANADRSETRGDLTVRGFLASLVEMAFQDGSASAANLPPPLSTQANAGMQGALAALSFVNGSSFGFSGGSLGSRPSYYVEGAGEAEGDAREGFGGGQGSNHSGQDQGDSREHEQGTSTYA